MKLLCTLLLIIFLGSCAKTATDNEITTCPEPQSLSWLSAKKTEFSSCVCLVNILQGIYNNQPVFETRIVDPLCNGVNVVYKTDGTVLLNSSDQAAYQAYLNSVKEAKVIWSCPKSKL